VLLGEAQAHARGDQDIHARTGFVQPRHDPGVGGEVLEIVQHQQRAARDERLDHLVEGVAPRCERHVARARDARGDPCASTMSSSSTSAVPSGYVA
jgi:hypothetical protein